jgi:hypothetical protein
MEILSILCLQRQFGHFSLGRVQFPDGNNSFGRYNGHFVNLLMETVFVA